ncbi:MAG: acylneuraminate cytidylyltransferase family protein [Candidatus Sulfotelmatobacter sp.]
MSKLIAIIPARSGSKRLAGKNLRAFFGHPIAAYAISAAVNSGLFAEVIVSSDDAAIGRVAESYGASFVLRPLELAGDSAQLVDVARHVLDVMRDRGIEPEAICQCMPNCPLLRSEDIRGHWKIFRENGRRFQISVVPYRGVYPQWAVVSEENAGRWLFGDRYLVRSQELSKTFCPTGAIWWARTQDFLGQNAFYGSPFHLAPMDANRGIDIDDEQDLELAELLVRGLTARDGQSPLEPIHHSAFASGRSNG